MNKFKAEYDTPEQIAKCLSCEKLYCDNCIRIDQIKGPKHKGVGGKPKRAVAVFDKNGDLVRVYESLSEAGRAFGVSHKYVRNSIKMGRAVKGCTFRMEADI